MLKKILLVDDNTNNRELLRSIIEMYADEHRLNIQITDAVDGKEASELAINEFFHIIFMDIMMPKMNGIEATQQIRLHNSKSLIIAVSAAEDETLTNQILSSGAEDYISKPVNVNIFTSRLNNYFSLIGTRDIKKLQNTDAYNLFTTNVYDRYLTFNIKGDDSLAEFWEYYLLNSKKSSPELSTIVRLIFDLANMNLDIGTILKVIVEESDTHTYFTLSNLDSLETLNIKSILLKHNCSSAYKKSNEDLSFQVLNNTIANDITILHPIKIDSNDSQNILETPHELFDIKTKNIIFNYIEGDDLEDLKGYISTLNSLLLLVGNEIERHEILEIAQNIDRISKITTVYTPSYPIGHALASMSREILSHTDLFFSNSAALSPLCAAFGRDLSNWVQLIFTDGAPRVDYLDETICANVALFISHLTTSQTASIQQNVNDIFDF
jgi:two-component system chemotaxis response regulator CheY